MKLDSLFHFFNILDLLSGSVLSSFNLSHQNLSRQHKEQQIKLCLPSLLSPWSFSLMIMMNLQSSPSSLRFVHSSTVLSFRRCWVKTCFDGNLLIMIQRSSCTCCGTFLIRFSSLQLSLFPTMRMKLFSFEKSSIPSFAINLTSLELWNTSTHLRQIPLA